MEGDILRDRFNDPVGGREKAKGDGGRATWVTPSKLLKIMVPEVGVEPTRSVSSTEF